MPSSVKKPLYISKSVGELNELASDPSRKPASKTASSLCKTASTLYKAAEDSHKSGDEERSYILFMRFYSVIELLKQTSDYKKDKNYYDELVVKNKFLRALQLSEKLQKSLFERYELIREEAEVRKKLEEKEKKELAESVNKSKKSEKTDDVVEFKDDISSKSVYSLMSKNQSFIIMDVRSSEDYEASRIKHHSCINIPNSILKPGITAEGVHSKLPLKAGVLWNTRSEVDYVILLDWASESIAAGTDLSCLRDAMCMWDRTKKLKKPPLLLKGGFEDWLLHYPTFTTNPHIQTRNVILDDKNSMPDILDLEYPDLDNHTKPPPILPTNLPEEKNNAEIKNNIDAEISTEVINKEIQMKTKPVIDRTVKPQFHISKDISNSGNVIHPSNDSSSDQPNSDYNQVSSSLDSKQNNHIPKVQRQLKPKPNQHDGLVVGDLKVLDKKLPENEVSDTDQNKNEVMTEKFKLLDENYKMAEEERLKLKEENEKMRLKMETISKESENLKIKEDKLEQALKEKEEQKLELETKMLNEKNKFMQKEARMNKKPLPKINIDESKSKDAAISQQKNTEPKIVKLKKEPSTPPPSSGLSRSHSSPNIAQLLADDGKANKKLMPNFDRSSKPSSRQASANSLDISKFNKIQNLDVNAARQRNLMPVYGSQGQGLTGLKNLGNTCFMNSIIQCLANTIHLGFYFLSGTFRHHINRQNKRGTRGDLAEEFSVVIRSIWCNQYRSITPKDFKLKAGKYIDVCVGYEQQDSHEFLTVIMEKLHQDVNTATVVGKLKAPVLDNLLQSEAVDAFWKNHKLLNQSVISELFEGLMCSTLQCLHCSKKSFSFEEFMCLSLPIPSSTSCTLKDCLLHFFKIERMAGEAKWFCPSCKAHREAEKKIDICKLPKILLIHLKRFSYDGMWRRKLQTQVDFPSSNLNITTFIPGPDSRQQYTLYGVSNHYGTLEGGHYTAFCKNTVKNRWYKFDDHEVSEISSSHVKTSAAYILFYTSLDQELPFNNTFNER